MQAMVFTQPGVVENLEVDEPEAGPGEVLLEVEAAGICGSELHGISKPGFRTPPLVMGHEFSGRAADGRRVVVNPIVNCGHCELCDSGLEQVCRERSIIGIHRAGAFAERVVVPERMLHVLPDELTWQQGALVEPLANGIHAWDLTARPKNARVGVIGAGTIGLVCMMAAARDTDDVTVVDLSDERLDIARQMGAHTATTLEGEYDVIIDAVGVAQTHADSVAKLRPGGTAVWIGLMGTDPAFDATELIRQEKRVLGTFAYPDRVFAEAVDMIPSCDLGWVQSFPLSQGAEIFMQLMNGRSDVVKAVLHP